MNKLTKYIEYGQTIMKQTINQRVYKCKNVSLKYMYFPSGESKELLIVFSACTRQGIPARYNYVRTLRSINANKLFILDDFGSDRRGGYYLGEYPEFLWEKATKELIDKIIYKYSINKCIFIGSSKGGWAALNFGVLYNRSGIGKGIVVGAPQFWLGKYLMAPANVDTFRSICGKNDENQVMAELDQHLYVQIKNNSYEGHQPIYIHYSNKEHTYIDHLVDLIQILTDEGYVLIEDVGDYESHEEVALEFPKFLKKTLLILLGDLNCED